MNAMMFNATPLLPHVAVQYLAVNLGWGLVLACVMVFAARRFEQTSRRVAVVLAMLALALCFIPGAASPSYWLGLAFQAPSLVTVLLCIWYLQNVWRRQSASQQPAPGLLTISVAGALIGWLLLLDTLALLPWQMYAAGFTPAATAAMFLFALLPWMMRGQSPLADIRIWIAPLAVGIFVAMRWPSGNVWDAVLDPWLWIFLNRFVIRSVSRRGRGAKAHG